MSEKPSDEIDRARNNYFEGGQGSGWYWNAMRPVFSRSSYGISSEEYIYWKTHVKGNPIYGKSAEDPLYWWMMGYDDPLDWEAGLEYALDFNSNYSWDDYLTISAYGVTKGQTFFKKLEIEYDFHLTMMNNEKSYGMSRHGHTFYGKMLATAIRYTKSIAPNMPNPFYMAEAIILDVGGTMFGSEADAGIAFMLVGPDKGKLFRLTELAGGGGTDAGFSSEIARIDLLGGPANHLSVKELDGYRRKAYMGFSPTCEGISAGGAFSWSIPTEMGQIVSIAVQIGVGWNTPWLFGGYNEGRMTIHGIDEN